MAPHTIIRLDGLGELDARLRRLSGPQFRSVVADSLYVAADPVVAAAIIGAPRGRGRPRAGRTRIASSIGKVVINRGTGGLISVAVGVRRSAFHAAFVERGTRPHLMRAAQNARAGRRPALHPGTPARPFLATAFRVAASRVLSIFRSELSRRLGLSNG